MISIGRKRHTIAFSAFKITLLTISGSSSGSLLQKFIPQGFLQGKSKYRRKAGTMGGMRKARTGVVLPLFRCYIVGQSFSLFYITIELVYLMLKIFLKNVLVSCIENSGLVVFRLNASRSWPKVAQESLAQRGPNGIIRYIAGDISCLLLMCNTQKWMAQVSSQEPLSEGLRRTRRPNCALLHQTIGEKHSLDLHQWLLNSVLNEVRF